MINGIEWHILKGNEVESRFSFDDPRRLEATVKITMTVAEWIRLRDQLEDKSDAWPYSDFQSVIADVLDQVSKDYYSEKIGEDERE